MYKASTGLQTICGPLTCMLKLKKKHVSGRGLWSILKHGASLHHAIAQDEKNYREAPSIKAQQDSAVQLRCMGAMHR